MLTHAGSVYFISFIFLTSSVVLQLMIGVIMDQVLYSLY